MELKQSMMFGVIGNFIGHLEQAKEAQAFDDSEHPDAPKGIFPFYIPNHEEFLSRYCLGKQLILDGTCVQIEPEVAIYFQINYENDQISSLSPLKFAAFNDASKRVEAPKIAEKKNFSDCCKGLGNWLKFTSWEDLAKLELCSYLKRDGEWIEYGQRKSVSNYCYFSNTLTQWLIKTLNEQESAGILSDIPSLVRIAKRPEFALICIGATPYTDFGVCNYLKSGDELFVGLAPVGAKCDYNSQPSDEISCFIQSVK